MKSLSSVLLLAAGFLFGSLAANTTQTDVSKPAKGSLGDGKIVMHQLCNSGPSNVEISSLKKELEMLRKELSRAFDKNGTKDPRIKLNRAPVCFGARGNQFGKFSVSSGGKLLAIKLVHLHGYVSCDTKKVYHWSYWGCGAHTGVGKFISIAITTSGNRILLPSSQFFTTGSKWSKIPGYNSLSPELVMSVFSSPLTVSSGQELRLWYAEDLTASTESDNGGKSCCGVFARII